MEIKGVKGIVWDLDGTLLNSFDVFEQVINDVVNEHGYTMPSRDFILKNYHGSLEETVQRMLNINSAEELNKVMNSFINKQGYHYDGDLNTHLYQDALMLAQQAAKQAIYQILVTNRDHKGRGTGSPRYIIAKTLLVDCIHEVFPGDEVKYRKPDIRSMGDWADRNQLLPSQIVVIGDQFVDAQLAINFGGRAILVKRDGDIPHLDQLTKHQQSDILVVESLDNIKFV